MRLDTDAELHAELATMRNDAFAERLADCIIGGKRPVEVVVTGKCFRQRLCFRTSLGDAKPHVRTWCRCCIAYQYHAAEHQAGRAKIINRREKWLIDMPQTIEVLRRQQSFGL